MSQPLNIFSFKSYYCEKTFYVRCVKVYNAIFHDITCFYTFSGSCYISGLMAFKEYFSLKKKSIFLFVSNTCMYHESTCAHVGTVFSNIHVK